MTFAPNPYQYSNPVYREGAFFDRRFALERLRLALDSARSVQLVGQFRIGKSSMLRHVQVRMAGLDDGRTLAIYYDMSRRPRVRNGDDFFARVWQMMSQALVARGQREAALASDLDLADSFEFDAYLDRWVMERGYRFVFLLDEFGLVASDENFDPNFFDNLRSTTQAVTYVLAAPRSLADFSHLGVSASPLWTVLQIIQLTLFENRQAVRDLVCQPAERLGLPWPDEAVRFIYERGGQHPCYIQMAASALYDTYILKGGQLDYDLADKTFSETAAEHFRYLWSKALDDRDRPERKAILQDALLDLVHGRNIDEDAAGELENRGLVWRDGLAGRWEPLSSWFGDWVRRRSGDQRQRPAAPGDVTPSRSGGALQEGQLIGGQYQVLKIVGLTEHSQVARAWDGDLKRMVAIKCLRLDRESDDMIQRFREALKREGQILAGLSHPYIGQVYAALSDPPGIVMEWVEGSSLRDILDGDERLPVADVIRIGVGLSDALNYAHKQDVFHRDVKPSNVILRMGADAVLKPVLIDFDIARAGNRDTISPGRAQGYVGTPPYSAPEQFLNPEGVGALTDMFALGIVLYELLTGKLPYAMGNLPAFYAGGRFPKPERFDIPEPVYALLLLLLNQQPDKRLTAGQFRHELVCLG
ncbi:MAG: serine/threonine protein kinase [Thermoflexales bacterium]|nr:serine/threonine protein kinase [Thermoflexales bacterium]